MNHSINNISVPMRTNVLVLTELIFWLQKQIATGKILENAVYCVVL